MSDDRTVHAWTRDGAQLVRYERAGKWYVEYDPKSMKPRRHVSLRAAAAFVVEAEAIGGTYVRRVGGSALATAVAQTRPMTESAGTYCCPDCAAVYRAAWQAESCAGTHHLERMFTPVPTKESE